MSEQRKRISITSTMPLAAYGGITGPIRKPFYETVPNISLLISGGAEVYEHIGDKKIKLNMLNFDADNSVVEEQSPRAKERETVKPVEQAKVDEIIKIPSEPNRNQTQSYKQKQKEKFNKNQQQQQQQQAKKPVVDEVVEE